MPEFTTIEVTETPYLYAERSCSMNPADISKTMGTAFHAVWDLMQAESIKPAGPALSVYYTYDPQTITFRAGFAVGREDMAKAGKGISADVTPAGKALHFTHHGSYATLRDDYALMMQYLEENGMQPGAPTWELYMNDPDLTPEDKLQTECYMKLA